MLYVRNKIETIPPNAADYGEMKSAEEDSMVDFLKPLENAWG